MAGWGDFGDGRIAIPNRRKEQVVMLLVVRVGAINRHTTEIAPLPSARLRRRVELATRPSRP